MKRFLSYLLHITNDRGFWFFCLQIVANHNAIHRLVVIVKTQYHPQIQSKNLLVQFTINLAYSVAAGLIVCHIHIGWSLFILYCCMLSHMLVTLPVKM